MAIARTAITDDDLSGTVGTVLNNAWKQELYDQIDAALGAVTKLSSSVNTNQNNWAPGVVGHTVIFWNGNADIDITGIAGGVAGALLTFKNSGTKVASFPHLSGSSSAANQFTNIATSAKTPVAPGGAASWYHDGTNWNLIAHEQGAWITPTFSAGNFTGNGSMTWTVGSGDVTTCKYKLRGKEVTLQFSIATTTVGGTRSSALQIGNGAWGGFSLTGEHSVGGMVADNGAGAGTWATGFVQASSGSTATAVQILLPSLATWAASTDNTSVRGAITFEVT